MKNKKSILWLTEDWAFDTDKEIVPYLKLHSGYEIIWLVFGNKNIPVSHEYELISKPYRSRDLRNFRFYKNVFNSHSIKDFSLIYSSFHGFPFYYPALFCAKRSGQAVIHAAHNVNSYPVWSLQLRIAVKMEFFMNSHFQMFSKHTARWFAAHYPQKDYFYAPMVNKDFGPVRTNNYTVDESKVNLLFFGNVVANKRLDLLIEAIKELPIEVQERIHLNICGKCKKNKDKFLDQICSCKSIKAYFKRIPDEEVPELFSKHQFLMLPYEDVAQSGPHMIAYNYNTPVIASDIDGFAERVKDGENGFLFHVGDKEALKKVITKAAMMTSDDYEKMNAALKSYVSNNFSKESVSKKYIEYFHQLTD